MAHATRQQEQVSVDWQPLVESLLVWAVALALLWAVKLLPDFVEWQEAVFGRPLLVVAIVFVLLPLAALWLTGRNPDSYGITFRQLRRPLEIGLTALAVIGPARSIAFPLLIALSLSPHSLGGSLTLALPLTPLIPNLIYTLLFVGFGEELFFRGNIQSSLNRA